jgi:hypothetical protein
VTPHDISNISILAVWQGNIDVTKVLIEAGASLSAVDNKVIKPSVKLRQSNITTQLYTTQVFYKQFSCHHHIKNHFSSQIFLKLAFSNSVQSHD